MHFSHMDKVHFVFNDEIDIQLKYLSWFIWIINRSQKLGLGMSWGHSLSGSVAERKILIEWSAYELAIRQIIQANSFERF